MKKIIILILALSSIIQAKMQVCVSITPQKFFVKKIAGDLVDVEVLVKEGSSPATYTPKPSQLKTIAKSKLYFTIDVAFEKNWLDRFKSINANLKLVDTTQGIKKVSMLEHHHHEKEEVHKEGLDPHIWLDPIFVIEQVTTISDALSKQDKKNEEIYSTNKDNFIKEIYALDKEIKEMLKDVKNRKFIVFHPSFGYFCRRYNLTQIAIEREGKEPSVKYLKKVIDFATTNSIKRVFVAPQFSQKSAKQIAKQINGKVITVNPLAYNWDENIEQIAKSFKGN